MSAQKKLAVGDLSKRVGEEIGVSPWLEVTQERIDLFAKAIDDPQWIHIDPERAKKGPFGTTIAHGFLTLSLLSHLIDYVRWFNGDVEAEWVMAQAAGRGKLADIHPSPDYVAGFIHFANGVHGVLECGAGAPDVPEVDYWWRKCRIGAQGTDGFAEVLTGGGWRAITRDGVSSGPGCMDYAHDMPPYVQDIADWLDDPNKLHPCNGETALRGFEIMMAACRSAIQRGKVTLPLGAGESELDALEQVLSAVHTGGV